MPHGSIKHDEKKKEENTWKPSDRAAAMFSHRIASVIIAWVVLHPAADVVWKSGSGREWCTEREPCFWRVIGLALSPVRWRGA